MVTERGTTALVMASPGDVGSSPVSWGIPLGSIATAHPTSSHSGLKPPMRLNWAACRNRAGASGRPLEKRRFPSGPRQQQPDRPDPGPARPGGQVAGSAAATPQCRDLRARTPHHGPRRGRRTRAPDAGRGPHSRRPPGRGRPQRSRRRAFGPCRRPLARPHCLARRSASMEQRPVTRGCGGGRRRALAEAETGAAGRRRRPCCRCPGEGHRRQGRRWGGGGAVISPSPPSRPGRSGAGTRRRRSAGPPGTGTPPARGRRCCFRTAASGTAARP